MPDAPAALLLVVLSSLARDAYAPCPNSCSGHGTCTTNTNTCVCNVGWGAATDVTYYRAPDCSQRVCPSGKAWADVPTAADTAHALAECSNAGVCERGSGTCRCFPGYAGDACHRSECPNDCSGHGTCVNLLQATSMINATPLSMAQVDYGGTLHTTTWDQEKIYGCVCDSSWTVGLLSGQTQETEYYGPDCSLRRCPTGDDPTTTGNETDCNGLGGDYTQGVLLGGGTTTATLHKAASSVTNFYNSMVIRFDAGTGANQLSIITAYNGSTRVATLSPAVTAPDATTSFTIFERGGIFAEGTATGGSNTYAVLANGSSTTNDYYNNMVLRITGGTGAGQAFSITDYTGSSKQAVLSKTPGTNTAADSTYTILGGQVGNLCHVDCSNRGACDASRGECQCYEGYYTVNCGQVNTSA